MTTGTPHHRTLEGIIRTSRVSVKYKVDVDGQTWMRHQNHIRLRYSTKPSRNVPSKRMLQMDPHLGFRIDNFSQEALDKMECFASINNWQ